MATITLTEFINGDNGWYGNGLLPAGTATTHTSTTFKYTTTAGHVVTLKGTGFTYDGPDGAPSGGTITSFTLTDSGNTWITATGLTTAFEDAYYTLVGWNTGEEQQNGNSGFAFSLLASGNDSIIGSDGDDDLFPGTNVGNDTINGLGGNDRIKGSAGYNVMDGGDGYDRLSYDESFYQQEAYRGATVNLLTGKVANPWGGTDTISNFERIDGSRLADKFTGDANNNFFEGLRGADTFNGGDGDDFVSYEDDARWGGTKAINVNLATGIITDGFGSKDKVSGIESVLGTAKNDVFVGDGGMNQFVGWRGVDSYDGGGGPDMITFWRNDYDDEAVGVRVDLSKSSGQVINDGFGNVETTTSIEWLWGSRLADKLTGNGGANVITGAGGKDTLKGNGGDDTFKFVAQVASGNAVIISDFVHNHDKLELRAGGMSGLGPSGELSADKFFAGAGATQGGDPNDRIVYDTTLGKLYYDANGSDAGGSTLIATLTGAPVLDAGDIIV